MPGQGVTAPTPFHTHPPFMGHRLPVFPVPSWREPRRPGLALPPAGSLPSFRLLLRMAKNCSRSSSTFKFSQQEALPAKGKDTEGLVGLEGSHVVGQKGPQSVLKHPPPPQLLASSRAGHPPEEILRDTAASSSLVQLNCSSRSSRSWEWARSPSAAVNGTPCPGWQTRQPRGPQAPRLGQWDPGTTTPYPRFHQQLPCDGEHGGEAEGGAHCGGRKG